MLNPFFDQLSEKFGPQFITKKFSEKVRLSLQTIGLRRRHLEKAQGVYGLVRIKHSSSIKPQESVIIQCETQIAIPMVQTVALVQSQEVGPISNNTGIHVTPGLVSVNHDSKLVEVEIQNVGNEVLQLEPKMAVAELH